MTHISRNALFLSTDGGRIDFISDESGEILVSVAIPPGRVSAAPYLDLMVDGATPEIIGVVVLNPRSAFGRLCYGEGSHATACNPDFAATPASALEGELRLAIRKMQASTKRIDARMAALNSMERVPRNEPDPVIEDIEPDPKTTSAPAADPNVTTE